MRERNYNRVLHGTAGHSARSVAESGNPKTPFSIPDTAYNRDTNMKQPLHVYHTLEKKKKSLQSFIFENEESMTDRKLFLMEEQIRMIDGEMAKIEASGEISEKMEEDERSKLDRQEWQKAIKDKYKKH